MFGLGLPCQLRVQGFIAPGPEIRCFLDSLQKISVAEPGWRYERCLIDYINPRSHHVPSACGSFGKVESFSHNLHDGKAACLKCSEVQLLVLDTFLEDQDRRGVALGDLYRVDQISQIEVAGMSAPEKVH